MLKLIAIAATTWLIMASSIYEFKVPGLTGNQINFADYKGKKILDGQVNAIKQDYKENYYRVTTDKSDFLQTNNGFSVIEQDGSEWTIQLLPGTSTNDVLQHLIVSGVTVKGFHEILPSLNDIFIRVVQGSESATRQFQSVTV